MIWVSQNAITHSFTIFYSSISIVLYPFQQYFGFVCICMYVYSRKPPLSELWQIHFELTQNIHLFIFRSRFPTSSLLVLDGTSSEIFFSNHSAFQIGHSENIGCVLLDNYSLLHQILHSPHTFPINNLSFWAAIIYKTIHNEHSW